MTEDERYALIHEFNNDYLDDEKINLNIQMSQPILVITDLDRWNGRFSGYKEIKSGNIRDCLYPDTDMTEWFVDRLGDLRADAIYHDGTNHYLYRVYKDEANVSQGEALKRKIYDKKATRADITKVTLCLRMKSSECTGFRFLGNPEVWRGDSLPVSFRNTQGRGSFSTFVSSHT